MILTPSQKFHSNVGDLGKIIVATNFEWLPKVQNITQSGHTGDNTHLSHEVEVHLTSCLTILD